MDSEVLGILKAIALKGGIDRFVPLSSSNLGNILGKSQQTASRKIQQLISDGWVERRIVSRKTQLRLTQRAIDVLRNEAADYYRIFYTSQTLTLTGALVSGLGEGKYYVTRAPYLKQIMETLGFSPYPGTLNVRVDKEMVEKLYLLKRMDGIILKGFEAEGRTFGDVKTFLCEFEDTMCGVLLPRRTHYTDIVEIIAPCNLREKYNLKDGNRVAINVHSV